MIKALFIDIDGTLKDSKGIVRSNTIDVIKRLRSKGIDVVLASGRSYEMTLSVSKLVGASPIIIADNGSIVGNYEKDEVIYAKYFSVDTVKKIYDYCSTHNVTMEVHYKDKQLFINSKSDIKSKILGITIRSSNYERMKIIKYLFKELVPMVSIADSSKELNFCRSKECIVYFHDLVPLNISKGKGVAEVMDYLDLKKDEVITIGDSDNDISMTYFTDLSVAMGNASNMLKELSTKVIDSNDNDGLYKYLLSLVDNMEDV